jgi:hypothetical protein
MPNNAKFASAEEALATLLPERSRRATPPLVPTTPELRWPDGTELAADVLERVDEHLKDSLSEKSE